LPEAVKTIHPSHHPAAPPTKNVPKVNFVLKMEPVYRAPSAPPMKSAKILAHFVTLKVTPVTFVRALGMNVMSDAPVLSANFVHH